MCVGGRCWRFMRERVNPQKSIVDHRVPLVFYSWENNKSLTCIEFTLQVKEDRSDQHQLISSSLEGPFKFVFHLYKWKGSRLRSSQLERPFQISSSRVPESVRLYLFDRLKATYSLKRILIMGNSFFDKFRFALFCMFFFPICLSLQ